MTDVISTTGAASTKPVTTSKTTEKTLEPIPLKDQLSDLANLLKALEKYKGVAMIGIDVIYGDGNSYSLNNDTGEFEFS